MKTHIGADVDSGLVHSLSCTAANVANIAETANLLHGQKAVVFADAGYTGVRGGADFLNAAISANSVL
jgi:transposase, IS5 family